MPDGNRANPPARADDLAAKEKANRDRMRREAEETLRNLLALLRRATDITRWRNDLCRSLLEICAKYGHRLDRVVPAMQTTPPSMIGGKRPPAAIVGIHSSAPVAAGGMNPEWGPRYGHSWVSYVLIDSATRSPKGDVTTLSIWSPDVAKAVPVWPGTNLYRNLEAEHRWDNLPALVSRYYLLDEMQWEIARFSMGSQDLKYNVFLNHCADYTKRVFWAIKPPTDTTSFHFFEDSTSIASPAGLMMVLLELEGRSPTSPRYPKDIRGAME